MVSSESLNMEAMISALKNRGYYSSTGCDFKPVSLTENTLNLVNSPAGVFASWELLTFLCANIEKI